MAPCWTTGVLFFRHTPVAPCAYPLLLAVNAAERRFTLHATYSYNSQDRLQIQSAGVQADKTQTNEMPTMKKLLLGQSNSSVFMPQTICTT